MTNFIVKLLDETTLPAYAQLIERHNGVWGGCWCMGFHEEGVGRHKTVEQNRREKECRVREGRAHAALVFDGDVAAGWCQFGPTDELPRIKNQKSYLEGLIRLPDWRITCFFVDRKYRGQGVAAMALEAATTEISRLGGGIVEGYPEDMEGRTLAGTFIYLGTVSMFERLGFERMRKIGKHRWVMTRNVEAQSAAQ